jgi:hypothetical protein
MLLVVKGGPNQMEKKRFIKIHKNYLVLIGVMFQLIIVKHCLAQIGLKPKLFAEVYSETTKMRREGNNTTSMTQSMQGIKITIPKFSRVKIYLKERYGSDANRDYWNNRGEVMLGLRLRFFQKIFLAAYFEYIQGKYFGIENSENPNPYGSNYKDMRGGLIFWQGLDVEYKDRWIRNVPLSFWDEIYSDVTFYNKDDENIIFCMNGKAGARLIRIYKSALDYYFVNYLMYDKNADFWNNKLEFGVGLRIKPWTDLELSLFVETVKGTYFDRDGRYENPNLSQYNDVRIGLLFWYGFGD